MPTEKEKLQKEFEYLSNLIAEHKLLQSVSCKDAGVECITSASALTSTKQIHRIYEEGSFNNSAQNVLAASLSGANIKPIETYFHNVSTQSFAISHGNSTFVAGRSRARQEQGSADIPITNPARVKSLVNRPASNLLTGRSESNHSKQGGTVLKNHVTKFIVHLSDLPSNHQTGELLGETTAATPHSNAGYCQQQRIENYSASASLPSGLLDTAINTNSCSSNSDTPDVIGIIKHAKLGISTRRPSKALSSASQSKVSASPLSATLFPKVDTEDECYARQSKKVFQSRTVLLPRSEISVSVEAASKPQFTCVLPSGPENYSALLKSHCSGYVESKWAKCSIDKVDNECGSVMTNVEMVRSNDRVKQSAANKTIDPFFEKVDHKGVDASCKANGSQIAVEAGVLNENIVGRTVGNIQLRSDANMAKVSTQGKQREINSITQNVTGMGTNIGLVGINNNRYKLVRSRNHNDQSRGILAPPTEKRASSGTAKLESNKGVTPVNKYRLVRPQIKVCCDVSSNATVHRSSQAIEHPLDVKSSTMLAQELKAGSIKDAPRGISSKYKLVKLAKDQHAVLCGASLTESSLASSLNSIANNSQSWVSTTVSHKTVVNPRKNLRLNDAGSATSLRVCSPGIGRQKVKYNSHSAIVLNKYKLVKYRQPAIKQQVYAAEISIAHAVSHIEKGKHSRGTAKPVQSRYKLNRRVSSGSSSVAQSRRKSGNGLNTAKQEDEVVPSGLSVVRSKYKLVRRKSVGNRQISSPGPSKSLLTTHATRRRSTSLLVVNKYKLIKRRPSRDSSQTHAHKSTWKSPLTYRLRNSTHWNSSPRLTFVGKEAATRMQICRKRSFVSKFALKRSTKGAYGDAYKVVRRRCNNVSRNMYKFINIDATLKHSKVMCKPRFPRKSQLKVDRRRSSVRRRGSGSAPLAFTKRFSLNRVPGRRVSGGNFFENSSPSVAVATQIVQRSLYKLVASQANRYRKASIESRRYCMYYNRFGRCTRADKCTFIHDPDKVSVCTRYLRGTCKVDDCPFSHSVAPHKMPACQYFLRGICSRDKCPYLHVKVADNAEPCLDFARGYCRHGDMCKKLHVLVCPNFKTTGTCTRGRQCPMRHLKQSIKLATKRTRNRSADDTALNMTNANAPSGSKNHLGKFEVIERIPPVIDFDDDDPTLPMKHRRMPSYIALNSSTDAYEDNDEQETKIKDEGSSIEPLVIRPRLDRPAVDVDHSWKLSL